MISDAPAPSIRLRLLALMAAGFCGLLLIISVLLWNYSRTAANKTYDLLLSGAALSILERVSAGTEGATVDIPSSAMEILGLSPRDRLVYSVFSYRRGNITGATDLPLPTGSAPQAEPAYFDAQYQGTDFRFIVQSRPVTVGDMREWIAVQVGQTREARNDQQFALLSYGLAGLAFVSLIGLAAVWLAINTALRPLQDIETDLAARLPSDLTPIGGHPPREVGSLFDAINSFIARLSASRSLNESFIADVAHQLRTSLSALQGQLSLASDCSDFDTMAARVTKAEAQAQRSVRLTNQLLANAMVIHRSEVANLTPIALTPIVRDLMTELIKDSAARNANFTLDAEIPEAMDLILGDTVSIREALRNLIDNALRHGAPSVDVDIDLRVENNDTLLLSVSDAGPGIPPHLRAKATERFVSLAAQTGGSGLGLAIVQAVATSHRAALRLETGKKGGLRAIIAFPRYKPARTLPGRGTVAGLLIAALAVVGVPRPAQAQDGNLVIYSATDTAAIAPLLNHYQATHPDQPITYREFHTRDLYELMVADPDPVPDIVISSAMDLQVDLVNRGLAQAADLTNLGRLPDWSHWRSELFGFTFEPAAIAYNPSLLSDADFPRTHQALASYIRGNQDTLFGRVGTYNVGRSGIGYLYATQELVQGLEGQRMTEVLGRAGAQVYCCTSEMLDAVARGDLVLATNVIGSYALAYATKDPRIKIGLMDDYNLVMSRSAFIPRGAAHPLEAAEFIDFLISAEGQNLMATESELIPIRPSAYLHTPALDLIAEHDGTFLPIPLRPSLLTYLDRLKMERFLNSWLDAVQVPPIYYPAAP